MKTFRTHFVRASIAFSQKLLPENSKIRLKTTNLAASQVSLTELALKSYNYDKSTHKLSDKLTDKPSNKQSDKSNNVNINNSINNNNNQSTILSYNNKKIAKSSANLNELFNISNTHQIQSNAITSEHSHINSFGSNSAAGNAFGLNSPAGSSGGPAGTVIGSTNLSGSINAAGNPSAAGTGAGGGLGYKNVEASVSANQFDEILNNIGNERWKLFAIVWNEIIFNLRQGT